MDNGQGIAPALLGQALLRAKTREALFQDICAIAVERSGFRLAGRGRKRVGLGPLGAFRITEAVREAGE